MVGNPYMMYWDNGVVYINESQRNGVSVEAVDGYQFTQGLVTPYLIKDVDRMQTVLENCAVFVTELQLLMTNEFIKMVGDIVASGTKDILVVCDEVHQDVIKFAVMNMLQGKFNMAIVKKPMQREYVEDIAAVVCTGVGVAIGND